MQSKHFYDTEYKCADNTGAVVSPLKPRFFIEIRLFLKPHISEDNKGLLVKFCRLIQYCTKLKSGDFRDFALMVAKVIRKNMLKRRILGNLDFKVMSKVNGRGHSFENS